MLTGFSGFRVLFFFFETWAAFLNLVMMGGKTMQLEYIEMDGPGSAEVWANLWQTECIVRVNVTSGRVTHWVVMHGLRDELARRPGNRGIDVLNGEAAQLWIIDG